MCAKKDILATLTYFDIFNYPVTYTEIFFFLSNHYSQEEFFEALQLLLKAEQIFQLDEFFSLQDDYQMVVRRRKGNVTAKKLLATAERIALFLSSFPFVRGIAVSGSLSKNFADDKSDVDFFIITAKNRLWIARTFMHLFKKLTFLLNKQHLFCMNYYVDEEGLEIKEKNIYTATELATLLPLRGTTAFQALYNSNLWSKDFLPNHISRLHAKEVKTTVLKKLIEWCLGNSLGDAIDFLCMKITANRWRKKTRQRKLNANGNIMGMDAHKHYAKPDPRTFQNKFIDTYKKTVVHVLNKYEQRLKPVY